MRSLFDPRQGLGLSYLRQPMGASDFVAGPHYTYDDVGAGQTDFGLKRFSIAHDRAEILPLLRQALRLNPSLKIMATPWSPPAWMKTNDSLVGGRFKDDPRVYAAYAQYFVRFVQEYPVGRAFQRAGIRTQILGYDHNWALHPNDVGPPGDAANPEYAASLLANPAARHYLAGTAFHCYFGDPQRQSDLHDAFPQKDVYFTECSGALSGDPATTFPDTLHRHTRFLTVGAVRNWAKTASSPGTSRSIPRAGRTTAAAKRASAS
jgi:glucosylceramidase